MEQTHIRLGYSNYRDFWLDSHVKRPRACYSNSRVSWPASLANHPGAVSTAQTEKKALVFWRLL